VGVGARVYIFFSEVKNKTYFKWRLICWTVKRVLPETYRFCAPAAEETENIELWWLVRIILTSRRPRLTPTSATRHVTRLNPPLPLGSILPHSMSNVSKNMIVIFSASYFMTFPNLLGTTGKTWKSHDMFSMCWTQLVRIGVLWGQFDPRLFFYCVKHRRNINFFIHLKGYLGRQQTHIEYLTLKIGKQYEL